MLTPATVILFLESTFCNVSEVALKFQFLSLINGLIFNSPISNLYLNTSFEDEIVASVITCFFDQIS